MNNMMHMYYLYEIYNNYLINYLFEIFKHVYILGIYFILVITLLNIFNHLMF